MTAALLDSKIEGGHAALCRQTGAGESSGLTRPFPFTAGKRTTVGSPALIY